MRILSSLPIWIRIAESIGQGAVQVCGARKNCPGNCCHTLIWGIAVPNRAGTGQLLKNNQIAYTK